jgi:hypothetical protein
MRPTKNFINPLFIKKAASVDTSQPIFFISTGPFPMAAKVALDVIWMAVVQLFHHTKHWRISPAVFGKRKVQHEPSFFDNYSI